MEKANVAWQQRRLTFRDDALADIAAEFNRYNRRLQIVVEDELARNKRYGGIFDAEDPESIIAFVSQDTDLSVRKEDGRIVISANKSR
jgi:transmembrane sensor